MPKYDERRAINGTFGEVVLEGETVREATGLKAEVQLEYLDVPMCGDLMKHQKVSGINGNGSITMTKVNSRMGILLSDMIKAGKTPSFTIISKLADPDAFGAERIVLKNCQFSTLSLADWSDNQIGTITQPFTFTDWDYLDKIEVE
ncbi:phage tail tube protein [Anaerotignum sp. MB30-C6]|uniref:phage tail tube protein n=1 Tax=Anaerotignum sp. MB30-C6 TaxID=3070814 RepID=UPI0027DE3DEC|nr:phage tail tube protein [Anaerotignum sp. MB30-C6]WMI81598.1 phage tail tube protein [Anaerotignum sp. MB30-C6]